LEPLATGRISGRRNRIFFYSFFLPYNREDNKKKMAETIFFFKFKI